MQRATAAVRLLAGDKEPVRLASTANLALAGLLTVDGVVTVAGDRILVKDQTDATENGIYTASEGTWYRAPDANSDRLLIAGMKVAVQEGTAHAGDIWNLMTNRPDLGDDDIEWEFYLSTDMVADINQAADDIIATIIALTNAADFASRTIAAGTTLPGGMTYLRTAGYAAAGDGGGALYKKVGAQPTHNGKFQSADGAWWEVVYLGQTMNLLQFGALGDGTTDDLAAIQGAIDFVAAAGGGPLHGVAGKSYRNVITTSITDKGLIIKSGVTLGLNGSTFNLECTGSVYGIRLQSNSHIIGPGTVATTVSASVSGQNIWHTPVSIGFAYGEGGTVASPSIYATPSKWSVRNLTLSNVRNDAATPGGSFINCWGGPHAGIIEDITILPSATVALGVAMDWAPLGNLDATDIPASRILFDAGTAYTLHPHDIEVRRITIGDLSNPNTGSFGTHGVRLSGVYDVRVEGVTIAGSTYAGLYNTAGDLGFEFAPSAIKHFRHKGIAFKDIRIEDANNGWGVFCDMYADNVDAAVGGGYSPLLPVVGHTDILFDNVFTQGSNTSSAWPGWRMQNMIGGQMRDCRARFHSVGVLVETNIDHFHIIGGQFDSNWTRGIYVTSGNPAEDLIIEKVNFFSNGLGAGATDAGIELDNVIRPIVRDCTIGITGEGFQDYGIRCTANCQDAIIEDNYVAGVATSGVAYSIASATDYNVLAKFDGNRSASGITTKYGGLNIVPYAYTVDIDSRVVLKCRAKRAALTGDTTPTAGTWTSGTIIEFVNPAAGGKFGSICTTTGSPGTWKQFGAIDA